VRSDTLPSRKFAVSIKQYILPFMLFTQEFVFLAFPKTGSSFVRTIIKSRGVELRKRHCLLPQFFWPKNVFVEQMVIRKSPAGIHQHGSRSQSEDEMVLKSSWHSTRINLWKRKNKRQIISVWRDPVDRFLSVFKFQFYALWDGEMREEVEKRYPTFPDWSLSDMYEWKSLEQKRRLKILFPNCEGDDLGIGPGSWQFILFFASKQLKDRLIEAWPKSESEVLEMFLIDTAEIHFLNQKGLNEQLESMLKGSAFEKTKSEEDQTARVNVTRQNHLFVSSHDVNEAELNEIRENEQFLYDYAEKRNLHC